jgi:hypothetical protein
MSCAVVKVSVYTLPIGKRRYRHHNTEEGGNASKP